MQKEIKVGLFSIATLVVLFFGIKYLQGQSFLASNLKLYAVYQSIDGLAVSNKVFYKGLQVGSVHELSFEKETGKIRVDFEISNTIKLPRNTRAVIFGVDLFGTKGIDLIPHGHWNETIVNGDRLQDSIAVGKIDNLEKQIYPLKDEIQAVISEIRVIVTELRKTVQDSSNRTNNIIQSIEVSASNIAKATGQLDATVKNVNRITDNVNGLLQRTSPSIEKISKNTAILSDSLLGLSPKVTQLAIDTRLAITNLQLLLAKTERGDGTIGKLFNDKTLYDNLTRATGSLDSLLTDLKNAPKRYVHFSLFGRKEPKPR